MLVDEGRGCGRVGQLLMEKVGEGFLLWGEAQGVRLAEPDQAGGYAEGKAGHLRIRRRGGGDRDTGDPERPAVQGDPIAGADAERVGERGLDHHAAAAQPAALSQLGLVDRGRCGVAALYPRVQRVAVCLELGPDDRIRSAVTGDAGSVGQRLQAGEVGGHAAVGGRGDACDHVGPGRGRSRGLVWLARGLAQAKPERQRRGRGGNRQEEERGLRRAAAQVARGEAADEQ